MFRKVLQVVCVVAGVSAVIFLVTREPKRPGLPKWEMQRKMLQEAEAVNEMQKRARKDALLVKTLLREDLSRRLFDFSVVVEASSGKKVKPLSRQRSGVRVVGMIEKVLAEVIDELNADDSPVRGLRRINEGSRFFEDGLMEGLNAVEGISCEIPRTIVGAVQRSGYPDLKITDEETGEVYYLDPKLMERGSEQSTFRSFYFAPKVETLKITDDATHLLVGIEHDGKDGEWTFLGWRLVDLSGLKVKLKAEFQASNLDMYDGIKMR